MTDSDLSSFLESYRKGNNTDVIQFDSGDGWGALFTLPAASPVALERAGAQFVRMAANRLRYVRQARLRREDGSKRAVVIMTTLPRREQSVYDLGTGKAVICRYLRDEALSSLEAAMGVDRD